MARRRDRARAAARRAAEWSVPEEAPAQPGGTGAADLHRLALERRRARMLERSGGAAPAATAEEAQDPAADLHRRAVELREYRLGRGPRPAGLDVPRARLTASGTILMTIPVKGMTCRSCEVRIGRFVGRLPHVQRATASAAHGRVVVESTQPVPPAAIERAINQAGYEVGGTPWVERDPRVWVTAGAGLVLVAGLAVLVQLTGVGDLASGAGDLGQGGLLVALLLGLAAGVSTCVALVGGLLLGLSAAYQGGAGAGAGAAAQLRPALAFVSGRVAGYTVLGGLLGAVGAGVTMPPLVTATLMVAAAVVMTVVGTRLTGLSPRMAGWSPTLPMGLATRLGIDGKQVTTYSDRRAMLLGAASFFLPCGFTQAIQVYALSTGSPLFGAGLLGLFALGTAPGLLAIAGLPVLVPSRAKPTLLRLVGVVVLAFAFLNGSAGLRLSGITLGWPSAVSAAEPSVTMLPDGSQQLRTYQEVNGYRPGNVAIYAGVPTRWVIESATSRSCAAFLVVPALGIDVVLSTGENVIQLPPLRPGRLNYMCSMGMYGGSITVVEPPSPSASPSAGASGGPSPAAVP